MLSDVRHTRGHLNGNFRCLWLVYFLEFFLDAVEADIGVGNPGGGVKLPAHNGYSFLILLLPLS
jgi:hypothetical protein